MPLNIKRRMKSAALQTARASASIRAGFISNQVLSTIRIEYDPPVAAKGALYPGGKRAAACLSIDFDVTVDDRFEANREGTKALVELSEEYRVPLTWAICGKTAEADRESYDRILNASQRKEIGIHTYSHIDAKKSDPLQFEQDIRKCLEVLGLSSAPPTFVFPWNREAHFDVLGRLGFRCYRGKERAIGAPRRNDEGLYNIRPVYYVDQKSSGAQSLMKSYADLCVSTSSVFHLWTHPWSIVMRDGSGPMLDTLRPVFSYLRKLSDRDQLALCTMGELSEHFSSSNPATPGTGAG